MTDIQPSNRSIFTAIVAGAVGAVLGVGFMIAATQFTSFQLTPEAPPPNVQILDQSEAPSAIAPTPSEPSVQAWDDHITSVIERVHPAVVSIAITKDLPKYRQQPMQNFFFDDFFNDPFFNQFFGQRVPQQQQQPVPDQGEEPQVQRQHVGGGSGFIATADGIVVTNKHVVNDGDADYTVITTDGTEYEAVVLARDPVFDLAYLKVEGTDGKEFPHLTFGDSDQIKLGQTVLAIGNALDEFRNSVTKGIVSGLNRRLMAGNGDGTSEVIEQAIQTDAAINPGNSGGPLLNLNGEVIGVNTAVSMSGQLIGFALPANLVKRGLEQVQTTGKISRAYLGVRYQIITDEMIEKNNLKVDHGAIVLRGMDPTDLAVIPGSPADKAGLRENDIILEIEGTPVDIDHSLSSLIAKHSPGDKIELKISRGGEEQVVSVILEDRE